MYAPRPISLLVTNKVSVLVYGKVEWIKCVVNLNRSILNNFR
jgi:hypothetical protein